MRYPIPTVSSLWVINPDHTMEIATSVTLLLATATAGVVIVKSPDSVDYAAACIALATAAICWLLTHERKDTTAHRLAWALLTVILGGLTPRVLANRGIIQETFADFGVVSVLAGMCVPLIYVALWKKLAIGGADLLATKAIDTISTK